MAEVGFEHVSKTFEGKRAVEDLTLDVNDGELLVLLGPSGCGKTTALRMVAGLEKPSSGAISIGGAVVNDVEPKDRDVAMVFQSYALYPHMTVEGNIEFPLRRQGLSASDRQSRVRSAAETLGLGELLGRKPGQLSGGQRQRVALARALVRDPKVFLMDEPLSNLDATLRSQTRADIVALQRRLGSTMLYVTHDQVEAMTMGHRIAVLNDGVLQQVAAPQEIYDRPCNAFVAKFLGSPGMNLVTGVLKEGGVWVGDRNIAPSPGVADGKTVIVGFRPESAALSSEGVGAEIILVEQLGAETHLFCRVTDDTTVVVRQTLGTARPEIGERVALALDSDALHFFDADTEQRIEFNG